MSRESGSRAEVQGEKRWRKERALLEKETKSWSEQHSRVTRNTEGTFEFSNHTFVRVPALFPVWLFHVNSGA